MGSLRQKKSLKPMSFEERQMRATSIEWGRKKWPDARMLQNMPTIAGKLDVVFVTPQTVIGVLIKTSHNQIYRLPEEVSALQRILPQVWVAVSDRWSGRILGTETLGKGFSLISNPKPDITLPYGAGLIVIKDGIIKQPTPLLGDPPYVKAGRGAVENTKLYAPMLDLLVHHELQAICKANGLHSYGQTWDFVDFVVCLSRELNGNTIRRYVCRELRARHVWWHGYKDSDAPIDPSGEGRST
jgi:hypothetical protein